MSFCLAPLKDMKMKTSVWMVLLKYPKLTGMIEYEVSAQLLKNISLNGRSKLEWKHVKSLHNAKEIKKARVSSTNSLM